MAKLVVTVRFPPHGPYDTGVRINNGAGYEAATTATLTVDDIYSLGGDASDIFSRGDEVFVKQSGKFVSLGNCSVAGTSTTVRIDHVSGGTNVAVADNEVLYVHDMGGILQAEIQNRGLTIGSTGVVECATVRGEILYTVSMFT